MPPARRKWLRRLLWTIGLLVTLAVAVVLGARLWLRAQLRPSGGPLRPAQAAYDVRRYDLEVAIDPATRTIAGRNRATVAVVAPLALFEIQLDDALAVTAAAVDGVAASFRHDDGLVTVTLPAPWRRGERHQVELAW